jgi:LPS export ABC transporter protein LptC
METPEEEPRSVRYRRTGWILGGFLLAILALFWGLRESRPKPNSPEAFAQGEKSPDAVIEKFHLVSTVQGRKRWELFSDTARLYQGQKQAYSDNIYAQYYKDEKLVSTLTADKAVINTETNATQAEGHVELITENGSKLETEKLLWDPDTDRIMTDARVHIYKGMDDITAVGLEADTQLNNIRFKKDVRTQVRDTREIEHFDKKKKF